MDLLQREYEESKGSSGKQKMLAKQYFNTSKLDQGSNRQPISMLEMAFNEINPYRENKFGVANITQDSMNITSALPGHLNEQESMGGSLKMKDRAD